MKLILEIAGALICVFSTLIYLSCCVVSGRCSRAEERSHHG